MNSLAQIWDALGPFQTQVVAFLLTSGAGLIAYFFRAKVKIIWGRANNSFHSLRTDPNNVANVYCEKLYVQNLGRKAAEKIEIILSRAPSEFAMYPPRTFDKKVLDNGQLSILLPYLSPRELVIIDTIHVNSPTAEIVSVHCPEAIGFRVNFWVQRKFHPFWYFLVTVIMALGAFYVVQLVVRFAAFIFLDRIP